MDVRFNNLNATSAQFADSITNNGPVVIDTISDPTPVLDRIHALRGVVDRAMVDQRPSVQDGARAAIASALAEVDEEIARPEPRRSRLRELLTSVTTASAGLTAAAAVAEAVQAAVAVVTGTP